MKILITEPDRFSPTALQLLQKAGDVSIGPFTRQQLLEGVKDAEVIMVRLGHNIDSEIIHSAPNLKVIISPTTGLDHIDLGSALEQEIAVLSLKGEVEFLRSIPATAELTWGLLLSLVRKIPSAVRSVKAGEWDRDAFRGTDLAGKRLGVLGYGRIGEKIAAYGLAFGMDVWVYDIQGKKVKESIKIASGMKSLFSECDIISIHIPLNESTQYLIGENELLHMKPGSWLINTSRGQVIKESILIAALESGVLRGAAVDVVCGEVDGSVQNSPLLAYARTHDNLIITPHIGGATNESMENTEIFMVRKFMNFLLEHPIAGKS